MSLEKILNGASVAVVGASKDETKRGFQAIRTLVDEKYEGKIYPVNPRETSIMGLKCYPSVSDIEDPVDMALITTPAKTIPSILEDCGRKGIGGVVIVAGGFREAGEDGETLENEMRQIAANNNIRIIGPNTSGVMNLKTNLNLVGLRDAPRGDIALISQSGNMALSLITEAKLKSLKGFSYYVGVGNESDLKFHEYLEFFEKDPGTKVILMYVEGMRDGRKFLQQAYKTTLKKPIVLLKGGRSATGKKSAGSHTGAMAGISEVAKTAFERAGIFMINSPDELFPAAEALSTLPYMKQNTVAVLADGGGHATIASDLLSDLGVEIPELDMNTQAQLKRILPPAAAVRNPVDVAGGTDADPTIFADCADILLRSANIGGLLIVGLFGGYGKRFAEILSLKEEDAAHRMGKLVKKRKKPIVVHSLYSSEKPHAHHLLRYYGIPVYDSLEVSCKCIGVLAQYGNYLKEYHAKTNFFFNTGAKAKKGAVAIIEKAMSEGRTSLLENEGKEILSLHGAQVSKDILARTAQDAVRIAKKIGGEVVLKVVSPDILHKSDAGGVRLNLKSDDNVREAFNSIMQSTAQYNPNADIRGVIVSPMASKGIEVIIGTKVDDQFGPVIMYGLGGILVEVIKDVAFRVLPLSERAARKMIEETKSYPLLNGFRGESNYDKKALKALLLLCSDMIESYPQIQEMDLNPVIVHEKGVSIVDARIILKSGHAA
jgi:acetyltransferase